MALTPDEARKLNCRGLLTQKQREFIRKLEGRIDSQLGENVEVGQTKIDEIVDLTKEEYTTLHNENLIQTLRYRYGSFSLELAKEGTTGEDSRHLIYLRHDQKNNFI
jgi:hypothetical protein